MRRITLLPACVAACSFWFAACASHHTASKTAVSRPVVPVLGAAVEPALPNGPDISGEVLGYLVVADGYRILRELAPMHERDADPASLQASMGKSIGLDPIVAQVLDLKRPGAVALLNPSLLAKGGVRPYVAMLPVISRAKVEAAFADRKVAIDKKPWGFTVMSEQGQIWVGFRAGYAVVAWRPELLKGAAELLTPKLLTRGDAPLVVHVNMENLYGAFGPQVEALAAHFGRLAARGGGGGDPQIAYALRGIKHLGRYVNSLSSLEFLANLDSGGLTFTARLEGKPDGAWAGYVQQQQSGPSWGTHFLPRDAVLVYTTHASARGRADDLESSVEYLAGAVPARRPAAPQVERMRRTLEKAVAATGGELAYAVWPGRAGGVGLGGAYRVTDPGMARAVMRAAYDELVGQIGGVVARALQFDAARFTPRFSAHQRQVRLGDIEADLVEVAVRWPNGAEAEKRVFEAMFGPKLVLATAFVGEQALFAVGADWQGRLETMIGIAQGRPAASVTDEPAFAEAQKFREGSRVSMSYLETGRMARFAAGLLSQANDLDGRQRAAVHALLGQVGRGAIVTTTNATGRRYEITTHVPHTAIMGAAQLNGALWRVALSPMLNPPMMPPLPIPPPHVMPSVTPPGLEPPRPSPSPDGAWKGEPAPAL